MAPCSLSGVHSALALPPCLSHLGKGPLALGCASPMHISPPTLCAYLPCPSPSPPHLPSDLMRIPPVHISRLTSCASLYACARLPPTPDPGDWQNGRSLSFCTPDPLRPASCRLLCGRNPLLHPDPRTEIPPAPFTRGHQALIHTGQTAEAEQAKERTRSCTLPTAPKSRWHVGAQCRSQPLGRSAGCVRVWEHTRRAPSWSGAAKGGKNIVSSAVFTFQKADLHRN